jgi:hypothetical protein
MESLRTKPRLLDAYLNSRLNEMTDTDQEAVASMTEMMKRNLELPEAPPISSNEIIRIVEEMQASECDPRAKAREFGDRYPRFLEQCPVLFKKACKSGLDLNMLRFMVDASSEGDNVGSEKVGQRLAKQFVYPNIS